jgi:ADP-ribosylglycohydrolase
MKAVNLGNDTDTVGAVAGGIAGLAYGYENIPKEWLDVIVKKDWINKLCEDFTNIML